MNFSSPTMQEVVADIFLRARNAAKVAELDPDGVVHYAAVADMLSELGMRVREAFDAFCVSKGSFHCTNTECPLKKTLAEGGVKWNP